MHLGFILLTFKIGQSSMRLKLFVLFILFTVNYKVISQTINGGYYAHKRNEQYREGYYFWNIDSTFIWFKQKESQKELGRGKYLLKGDSIILFFENARERFTLDHESFRNYSGKSTIEVIAFKSNKEPVEGLEFKLEESGIKGTTDSAGSFKGEFNIEKANQSIHFFKPETRTFDTRMRFKGMHNIFTIAWQDNIKHKANIRVSQRIDLHGRFLVINDVKMKRKSKYSFLGKYHRI
jgi:hypothetical protein